MRTTAAHVVDTRILKLQCRVAELEAENAALREESAAYLRRWIAAQDLAALRNVLLCAAKPDGGQCSAGV